MEAAVAVQSVLLFVAAVTGICGAFCLKYSQLGLYLLGWSAFHALEYITTALYLEQILGPYLFLITGARGSVQLMAAHVISVLEHVVWQRSGWISIGSLMVVAGIVIRALAIRTCGRLFSHYIETSSPRTLVTHGIYSWCRHPSYLGFFVYVAGMEILLGNIVSGPVCLAVLVYFFRRRIQVEEAFLHRLYGPAYGEYLARVGAVVPWFG